MADDEKLPSVIEPEVLPRAASEVQFSCSHCDRHLEAAGAFQAAHQLIARENDRLRADLAKAHEEIDRLKTTLQEWMRNDREQLRVAVEALGKYAALEGWDQGHKHGVTAYAWARAALAEIKGDGK